MNWKTQDEFPGSISLPYGIKTSHTWHEIGQILRTINDFDIQMFVEVGAHVGGLASIIAPLIEYKDFIYVGLEIDESIVHPEVRSYIQIADVMDIQTIQNIKDATTKRKTFIYCDNGNKVNEMALYASILKRGDVIACHDYFDGQTVQSLGGFGVDDSCGCKPEVWKRDLQLFHTSGYEQLPEYLLAGTRIMGFIKL
jgi:hypothetical protein